MIRTNPVYKVVVELIIDVDNENFHDGEINSIVKEYLEDKFSKDSGLKVSDDCYLDSYNIDYIVPISEAD